MEFSSSSLRPRGPGRSWLSLPVRFVQYLWAHKIVTAVVIIVAFGFYWFQMRPVRIARACAAQASLDARLLLKSKAQLAKEKDTRASYEALVAKNMYLRSDYDSFIQKCLLHYGYQISKLQTAPAVEAQEGETK